MVFQSLTLAGMIKNLIRSTPRQNLKVGVSGVPTWIRGLKSESWLIEYYPGLSQRCPT